MKLLSTYSENLHASVGFFLPWLNIPNSFLVSSFSFWVASGWLKATLNINTHTHTHTYNCVSIKVQNSYQILQEFCKAPNDQELSSNTNSSNNNTINILIGFLDPGKCSLLGEYELLHLSQMGTQIIPLSLRINFISHLAAGMCEMVPNCFLQTQHLY